MEVWWSSLGVALQIFYAIGIVSGIAVLMQVALIFLGGVDSELGDFDADTGGGDHPHGSGLKIISFQAITAFLLGLGWIGAFVLVNTGWLILAVLVGLVAGLGMMFAMAWLLAFLAQFKEEGNVDFNNAIGETGKVYVPIPGERGGCGQIEIIFQGRHQVLEAITSHASELKAHTQVLVVDLAEGNTLVVRPI